VRCVQVNYKYRISFSAWTHYSWTISFGIPCDEILHLKIISNIPVYNSCWLVVLRFSIRFIVLCWHLYTFFLFFSFFLLFNIYTVVYIVYYIICSNTRHEFEYIRIHDAILIIKNNKNAVVLINARASGEYLFGQLNFGRVRVV